MKVRAGIRNLCALFFFLRCLLLGRVSRNPILFVWAILAVLTFSSAANAQGGRWALENRIYFDATPAEIHAAQTQVLFPMFTDAFQYSLHPGRHHGWDIDLGHEFPIFGYDSNASGLNPQGVAAGEWGVGLWFPLSFHMVEDLGTEPSNPILDTDYRFSGMIKFQYGLPRDWAHTRNSHLGFRFQFGHESTHVGDEFTINATSHFGDQFKRVNVSYEYYDLGFSFEPNFGKDGHHRIKLRAGNIALFNPDNGWYNSQLEHPDGAIIARSRRNIEPYAQIEYSTEWSPASGWMSGDGFRRFLATRFNPIVSCDIRDRTVYNYEKLSRAQPEDTEISSNIYLGLQHKTISDTIRPTYYVRYYHGVNPMGQFRNQSNYTLFGFGVHFDF